MAIQSDHHLCNTEFAYQKWNRETETGGTNTMPCKCVECGGKTDCDSIICASCLAEIIDRVNYKNNAGKVKNELQASGMEQSV
jgi:hypothetical protein